MQRGYIAAYRIMRCSEGRYPVSATGSKATKVSSVIIAVFLLALCVGCAHEYQGATAATPPYQRSPIKCRHDAVEQIWIRQAYDHQIDPEAIECVCELFEQVVEPGDFANDVETQEFDSAIDRFLDQFGRRLNDERPEGVCYWTAWLLAQSAVRPVASEIEVQATHAWFGQYTDEIIHAYDAKLRETLNAEEYARFEPQITESLGRVKARLQAYFDDLSGDPLFPIFKEPLGAHAQGRISEHMTRQAVPAYSLPEVPEFSMTPERYVQNLDAYFKTVPDRVVFWMALYETGREVRRSEYWGGMLCGASSDRYNAWPIEMHLKPMPALLRASQPVSQDDRT